MLTARQIAKRLKKIMDCKEPGAQLQELRKEITIGPGSIAQPNLDAIVQTFHWVAAIERNAREELRHKLQMKIWWLPLLISLGSLAAVIFLKN